MVGIVHDLGVGISTFTNDDGDEVEVPLDAFLVSAFWSHSAAGLDSDEYLWAWEAVHRATTEQVDGVVSLLVAIADAAAGRLEDLAYLGASAFEDLLRYGRRPASAGILDELDEAARSNENVRLAVRAMWWGDDDDPQTVARFSRFGPTY